jgi:hypothetical protein
MDLCDVRDRLQADDDGKWDQLTERDEMRLEDGRIVFGRLYRADHPRGLGLTPWATAQMCQRLSIPTAYYKRCPVGLQDDQVNYWMHREPERGEREPSERWLLRSKGDTVRGILSERYAKVNNADVFRNLEPLVKERYQVTWLALTEESLHLRLVDPTLAREVTPGDRVLAGLHIANSEVGRRAVTLDALVYRLVCTNGLIRLVKGRSLLRQRHISLSQPRFELALTRAIRDAITEGTAFLERMIQSTREAIPDVAGSLTAIAVQWAWGETLQEQVTEALLLERSHQENLFGLVNAITSVAQRQDPDGRYSLEALAGHLLDKGAPRPIPAGERPRAIRAATLFEPEALVA